MLFDEYENTHYNGYIQFLQQDGTLESKKMLVAAYYSYNNYANAMQILASIPTNTTENRAFVDYYGIMLSLKSSGKNIYQMNEGQQNTMRNIANGSTLTSASARGVIRLVYGDEFDHTPMGPEIAEGGEQEGDEESGSQNNSLLVFPNPALIGSSPNITIQYNLTDYTNTTLKVLNSIGEIRYTSQINQLTGQVELSTSSLGSGMYVAQLIVNGAVVSYKVFTLVQ
jgi:hypothetical protein